MNVEAGGDYDAGTSTCQGAGGGPFYSYNTITNVDVLGGSFIACNHALNGNNANSGPGNGIYDARFPVRTDRAMRTARRSRRRRRA